MLFQGIRTEEIVQQISSKNAIPNIRKVVQRYHKDQGINGAYRQLLPPVLADDLDQLVFFTDDELWQTAQTQLQADDHERMEALLAKPQRSGLDTDEFAEADNRAVLTINRKHFRNLHRETPDHKGVVLCTADNDLLVKHTAFTKLWKFMKHWMASSFE